MAVRCNRNEPKTASIAQATVTLLVPGEDVRIIWVTSDSPLWLFYSATLADGASTPASDRIPIVANEKYPVVLGAGKRALLASQSGTVSAVCYGAYE